MREIVISSVAIYIVSIFVFAVVSLYFFIFFLKTYIKTKQKMFGYLSVYFLTHILANIFGISKLSSNGDIATNFHILNKIFEMLVLLVLILLLEVFEKNIQFSTKQTIMTMLIFTIIGGFISDPPSRDDFLNYFNIFTYHGSPILILQAIFYILTVFWLAIMLYRSKKKAWSLKQKTFMSRLIVGVFLSISSALIPVLVEITDPFEYGTLFVIIVTITFMVQHFGVYINGYAFLKVWKNPWLLQRQKIHLLLVFNKNGIELFTKSFDRELNLGDSVLIGGVFSGINSLIQETTKTKTHIESINLKGKELRFITRENFVSAIIIDYSTQASEIAHNKFAKDFEKKFSRNLAVLQGQTSNFSSAEEIALTYFS